MLLDTMHGLNQYPMLRQLNVLDKEELEHGLYLERVVTNPSPAL